MNFLFSLQKQKVAGASSTFSLGFNTASIKRPKNSNLVKVS